MLFQKQFIDFLKKQRLVFERYHSLHKEDYDYWEGLGGLCAKAAHRIWLKGKRFYPNILIAHNKKHAFNFLNDYIIDITATQFDPFEDSVLIINSKEATNRWYYRGYELFGEPKLFLASLSKWPSSQKPRLVYIK